MHLKVEFYCGAGGNEYGQCGEEPERKDDTGRPVRRDIVIPQRCVPKLSVRQVTQLNLSEFRASCNFITVWMWLAKQDR